MRLQNYRSSVGKISSKPLFLGTISLLVVALCVGSFVHRAIVQLRHFEQLLEENKSGAAGADLGGNRQQLQQVRHKRSSEEDLPVLATFGTGTTYVRWGRYDCPGKTGTSLVYHGYTGGSHYSHVGGGSDFLCLHHNVTYTQGHYIDVSQGPAYIYGAEYREGSNRYSLFDLSFIEEEALQYQGVPCAVCLVQSPAKLMIPSRETCPEGWTIEYTGYIMTGSHNTVKHSSSHLCVDRTPQVIPGTKGNQHGAYLFVAEIQCGYNVPCEPYVQGREVTCVVCSLG